MDAKFADRMNELAEISTELLEQRWSTVVTVANSTADDTKVRLVLIACGEKVDRDTDEWFWRPFREVEPTFPVDNGKALHSRLAEATARYLINAEQDSITAMLVRLAVNVGHTPQSQDLIDDAVKHLAEVDEELPVYAAPGTIWNEKIQTSLQEAPNDPATLQTNLIALGSATQAAVTALAKQTSGLVQWARYADRRFKADQGLIQWLLRGARSDGKPWSGLSAGAVAVDAAVETAEYVVGAPQSRHEGLLLQVLAVAGKGDTAIKSAVKDHAVTVSAPPEGLAVLTPITAALAAGKAIPKRKPSELAIRMLWETRTIEAWNEA
jgi:hypothetical protein